MTRRSGDPAADGPVSVPVSAARETSAGLPDRWLVSVSLPVEACSPADAVRRFWDYVAQLGPGELPVYVAPVGHELATRAYLREAPTNLDPEED